MNIFWFCTVFLAGAVTMALLLILWANITSRGNTKRENELLYFWDRTIEFQEKQIKRLDKLIKVIKEK